MFNRQPLIVDEEILILCLHVGDLHAAEVPAGILAAVVVPDPTTNGFEEELLKHAAFDRVKQSSPHYKEN